MLRWLLPIPGFCLTLTLTLTLGACAFDEDTLGDQETEAPDVAPAVELVAWRDGSYILASAATPPVDTARQEGRLVLEYVGPHRYASPADVGPAEQAPVDVAVDDDSEDADPAGFRTETIRFVDEEGHEWRVLQADDIDNHTPRLAAYPTLHMGEEATCQYSSLLEGERNLGDFHGFLTQEVRVDITSGGGSSGGPYYYFGNANYEVFGVHSYRGNVLGNKFSAGPKVPFWYDDIVAAAGGLGVTL